MSGDALESVRMALVQQKENLEDAIGSIGEHAVMVGDVDRLEGELVGIRAALAYIDNVRRTGNAYGRHADG